MAPARHVAVRALLPLAVLALVCACGQVEAEQSGAAAGTSRQATVDQVPGLDGSVERAPVAPRPQRVPPLLLRLPVGMPMPPAGSGATPPGRPASAREAATYARAVRALGARPFRVVRRDVLLPDRVELLDEDPRAEVVRTALVQGGVAAVTRMDVQGRSLVAAGSPDAYDGDVARPGEQWLEQRYQPVVPSPTLYVLDPRDRVLEVAGAGRFLLRDARELGASSEVVLDGDRVVSWHTWYPEDVGNASDAGEYASLLLDLPPDARLATPDPATVVGVAEQARRAAERRPQESPPTRSCGEPVDGVVSCSESSPVPPAYGPVAPSAAAPAPLGR